MTVDPLIVAAYFAALVSAYFAGYSIGAVIKFINAIGKGC